MAKYSLRQGVLVNWYCLKHVKRRSKTAQNELLDCMLDNCMLLILNYLLGSHAKISLDYSLSSVLASRLLFMPHQNLRSQAAAGNLAISQLLLL